MFLSKFEINILHLIYFFIPLALVTGPALPDLLLFSFLILSIIFFISKKQKFDIKFESWMMVLIILWIWFIFISFFAINFKSSITDALIFIRFILFIILSYAIFSSINKKILFFFLSSLFFLCILVALDTLFQFYNYSYYYGFREDLFGRIPEGESGIYGRLSGPFLDLVPGSFLSRFVFFNILLIYLSYDLIKKNILFIIIYIFSLSLIVSLIYFSGEKMALATTGLGYLLCIIFSKKIRLILLFSIIISLLFILINLKLHPHYNNYEIISSSAQHDGLMIKRQFSCNENEICEKIFKVQPKFTEVVKNFKESAYGEIYLTSFNMWKDNILLGIGLNNFSLLFCDKQNKYSKYHQNLECTTHPHNIYLQALLESGLIGFVIFCLFVFLFFYKVNSIKSIESKIILFSALLAIFWPIMSTGSFLKNWNMVFICLVCSLCLICVRFINHNKV